MRSIIKASIIFSASGAALAGLQSARFDKVCSVHLSIKWGYQQAMEAAGFNSVRMELTFTSSVRAPSARASWLSWLSGFSCQEEAGWLYSPRGTRRHRWRVSSATSHCTSSWVPAGCLCLMMAQVPKQSGQRAHPCCWEGGLPKQLEFCSSWVHAGWWLRK